MNRGNAGQRSWVAKSAFVGFALIAAYFLFTEHRAHIFASLPWLLLLACPLLHLFHKHGGHESHGRDARAPDGPVISATGSSSEPLRHHQG